MTGCACGQQAVAGLERADDVLLHRRRGQEVAAHQDGAMASRSRQVSVSGVSFVGRAIASTLRFPHEHGGRGRVLW